MQVVAQTHLKSMRVESEKVHCLNISAPRDKSKVFVTYKKKPVYVGSRALPSEDTGTWVSSILSHHQLSTSPSDLHRQGRGIKKKQHEVFREEVWKCPELFQSFLGLFAIISVASILFGLKFLQTKLQG